MNFALGNAVNPDKVFIERKSNVVGRWDPFYFRPELVALEKRVWKVAQRRLRDFVRYMAGGATPSTKEAEVHYTERDDGVPFIRVQNLSVTGRLDFEDCKRITRDTHERLLRRSRLRGGELLVKITGVGRMAVASVVPEGLEGNINQHIVAIRTDSIKTSEMLAGYLNLDMVERLASRRSTGGTRPALDYPALLSIPVVRDERLPRLMNAAVDRYKRQVDEATALLSTVDDVLLDELAITRQPEPPDTLQGRIFSQSFSEVTGERFDAYFHHPKFERLNAELRKHPHAPLRNLVRFSTEQWDQSSFFESEFPYIEIGAVDIGLGKLGPPSMIPVAEAASRAKMLVRPKDLLVSLTRPTRRAICFVPDNIELAVASNGFSVIREFKDATINGRFLFHVLRSLLCTAQFAQRSSGGNYPAITEEQLSSIVIPLAKAEEQERISRLLDSQYSRAERLYDQARTELEKAKREIEAMILGGGFAQ